MITNKTKDLSSLSDKTTIKTAIIMTSSALNYKL